MRGSETTPSSCEEQGLMSRDQFWLDWSQCLAFGGIYIKICKWPRRKGSQLRGGVDVDWRWGLSSSSQPPLSSSTTAPPQPVGRQRGATSFPPPTQSPASASAPALNPGFFMQSWFPHFHFHHQPLLLWHSLLQHLLLLLLLFFLLSWFPDFHLSSCSSFYSCSLSWFFYTPDFLIYTYPLLTGMFSRTRKFATHCNMHD